MTVGEFLVRLAVRGAADVNWDQVDSAYDALDVDPDAPIPTWNEEAQAWEV